MSKHSISLHQNAKSSTYRPRRRRQSSEMLQPKQVLYSLIPQELLLRYTVDDGMIVWINGFEVHRFNVASGTLPASATASTSGSEGTWRDQSLTGAPGYLVEGNNTIAIQLFNVSSTSSDLGLDIELIRPASGDNQPALPTPGKRNSVYSSNAPPITRQVNHFPRQPEAGVDTVISAKITDSNGMESVTLEYQRVVAGSYIPALLSKWGSRFVI